MRNLCAAVAMATILTSACTTFDSSGSASLRSGGGDDLGWYNVPQTELVAELHLVRSDDGEVSREGLILVVARPEVIAGETVHLSASYSPLSADKLRTERDPFGFLKRVTLNLEDKTGEGVVAMAGSMGGFFARGGSLGEAGDPTQGAVVKVVGGTTLRADRLGMVVFDPTDRASLNLANMSLWRSALQFLKWRQDTCGTSTADGLCGGQRGFSKEVARFLATDAEGKPINPTWNETAVADLAYRAPFVRFDNPSRYSGSATCGDLMARGGQGICVRAARQVNLTLVPGWGPAMTVGGPMFVAEELGLFDVERAVFATKTATMDFSLGVPMISETSQTSQFLTVAGLPKQALDAFIDSAHKTTLALSELVKVRVDYRTQVEAAKKTTTTTQTTESTDAAGNKSTKETTTTETKESKEPPPEAGGKQTNVTPPPDDGRTNLEAPTSDRVYWMATCSFGLDCKAALATISPIRIKDVPRTEDAPVDEEQAAEELTPGKDPKKDPPKPALAAPATPTGAQQPTPVKPETEATQEETG